MIKYKINYRFQFKKSVLFRLQRAVCEWVGRAFRNENEMIMKMIYPQRIM